MRLFNDLSFPSHFVSSCSLVTLGTDGYITHRYCWEINVGKSKIKLCTSVFTKEKKYLRHRDFSGVKDFNSIASQTVNILL